MLVTWSRPAVLVSPLPGSTAKSRRCETVTGSANRYVTPACTVTSWWSAVTAWKKTGSSWSSTGTSERTDVVGRNQKA